MASAVLAWLVRCPIADPEQARRWRMLNAALLILSVLATLAGSALLLCGARWIGEIGLVTAAIYVVLYMVNHRGAVGLAGFALIWLAMGAVVVASLDPTRELLFAAIVPLMYVIPIVLAGALLSWRAVIAAMFTAACAMSWLYLAGIPQLAPYRSAHPDEIAALTSLLVVVFVAVGSFVAVFNRQLMTERRRDLVQRRIIDEQRAALADLNVGLERRVKEQVTEIVERAQEVNELNAQLHAKVRARSAELSIALAKLAQRHSDGRLRPGVVVGDRFEIDEMLGAGGMGAVYAGIDRANGTRVAIKIIQASSSGQLDALHRFIREAGTAAKVDHPAVARMIHVDVSDDGMLFQAQELVEGDTLQRRLRRGERWEPGIVARLGSVLCEALAAAHAVGVIHRDVKPANMMITAVTPGLKLLDFGISKIYDDAPGDDVVTRTGAFLGTPAYVAPEQVGGAARVTDRADIYSVGVTLFLLLTGRFPFEEATPRGTVISALVGTAPDVRSLQSDTPEALAGLVARCLKKDPGLRPSAVELAEELAAFAERSGVPRLEVLACEGALTGIAGRSEVQERPSDPRRPRAPSEGDLPSESEDSVDSFLREVAAISEPGHGAHPPPRLNAGDVLSERFVIERLAGSGGMGAVYRATDQSTGAPVAVKVMAGARVRDSARFAREALVLAQLSHPAIVRYVAHGSSGDTPFFVMEWLDGEDLSQRLAGPGLRMTETLALLRRVCEGMAAAHRRGVVHRDLKPSNLFLCGGDAASAKVVDFGVARFEAGAQALTRTGTVLGTVGYMAPEQAMSALDVDARADIFALGCVLFECLTGQPAFAGPQPAVALEKLLRGQPPRVSEARPGLPAALDTLLLRMLAKDRDDRPEDAAAVLDALDALLPSVGRAAI